jgi:predicted ABC-type transport system involved in lysophospholipase L1 biosynthesis ATPase subunit
MNTLNENKNPAEQEIQHLIEIHGIGKDYQEGESKVEAIKQMDFHIDDGEFVAIMGQSGSGKSTLLSILGGLNHPSRGKVLLDTLDVYELSSEQRADLRSEYIGVIFQSFQLIPYLTVLENVKLPMGLPIRPTAFRISFPAANRNGLPLPGQSSINRLSCWRMNPPAALTAKPPMKY